MEATLDKARTKIKEHKKNIYTDPLNFFKKD